MAARDHEEVAVLTISFLVCWLGGGCGWFDFPLLFLSNSSSSSFHLLLALYLFFPPLLLEQWEICRLRLDMNLTNSLGNLAFGGGAGGFIRQGGSYNAVETLV